MNWLVALFAAVGLMATAYAQTPRIAADGLIEVDGRRAALEGVERPVSAAQRVRWQQLFDLLPWRAEFSDDDVRLRWQGHRANRLLVLAGAATPDQGAEALQVASSRTSGQSQQIMSLEIDGLTYPPFQSFYYSLGNLTVHIDTSYGLVCQSQGAPPQHSPATIIAILDGKFLLLANRGEDKPLVNADFDDDLVSIITPRGDQICGTPSALRATMAVARETTLGEAAIFTLKVFNEIDSALQSPQVDIAIPADVGLVSAGGNGWSCQSSAGGARCARSTLPADASHRIELTLSPAGPGELALSCTASMASAGAVNDHGCSAVTNVVENLDDLFRDRFEALAAVLSQWSTK